MSLRKMPLIISIPHASLHIPYEVQDTYCLNEQEVKKEADLGADTIFTFHTEAEAVIESTAARVIVDVNRRPDDFGDDGVIKRVTTYNKVIYCQSPTRGVKDSLLEKHYHPYHREIVGAMEKRNLMAGVDCHTMEGIGPPLCPDPGAVRPWVCIGDVEHSFPEKWLRPLMECFADQFKGNVALNKPYRGGYVVRQHSKSLPWIQIEISREAFMSNSDKRERVQKALDAWLSKVTR